MPYKNIEKRRAAVRRSKAKRAKATAAAIKPAKVPAWPADPAGALAKWSREVLRVPAGHPLAGKPMVLPAYGVAFLADALTHRESLLCLGRKNAKSAVIAVYLLARLIGPLRTGGYRAGVCSVNKDKANELKMQMEGIAEASSLTGLTFRRSPAPGRVESATGTVDILSAEKSAGHGSGFDDAIVDEIGLFQERDRELVNGMRSSTSAKNGRFIALSIQGTAPFTREMIARANNPALALHLYRAAEGCDLDDPVAWHAANPGIAAGIKSLDYMQAEALRVLATPSDAPSFRAFDLNQPQAPGRVMIFDTTALASCEVEELPERDGPVVIGLDAGEATSATAAFAIWPNTGRCESWMAFGDIPSLHERGQRDNAAYELMEQRGELRTYPGRVTPVSAFMADVAAELAGCTVRAIAADGYKDAEIMDFLDRARLRWPRQFRRVGAGKQGGADVRSLQRLVLGGRLKMKQSLAFTSAVANSAIRRDGNGNPALDKSTSNGRIDLLSAAAIAAGMAEPLMDKPSRAGVYMGIA